MKPLEKIAIGTLLNLGADFGQYTAVIVGVVNVLRDEPNLERAGYAGLAYVGLGFVKYLARTLPQNNSNERNNGKQIGKDTSC